MEYSNLKLSCDYEKYYPSPNEYINKNGNNKYAFVTLVMLGDKYVSGAMVLAYSLKKHGSKVDLIVLVTKDVSFKAKEILKKFYDKVIEVEYIRFPNWRTKIQKYRKYLDYVFTKFHCLELTEYDKVALIDADAVMLNNSDHIFTLNTPAGVLLENKSLFLTYNEAGEYVLPKDGKIEWYKKLCDCCGHGKIIPKEITDRVLKDRKNSGIAGGLMLLKPKKGKLDKIIEDLNTKKSFNLVNKFFLWPEQQYLTQYYSGKWTSINPIFLGLQGYPHWKYLFGVQYAGDKPFILKFKTSIEDRKKYADFQLWHMFYNEIINNYPELKNMKPLEEVNEVHKYLKNDNILEKVYKDYRIYISKIYNINEIDIKPDNVKYYYINKKTYYQPKWYNKILFDVKQNDYEELIYKLREYYKNTKSDYFKNIDIKKNDRLVDIKVPEEDRDNLALMYAMCRPNSFGIFLWNRAVELKNNLISKLDGDVYYYKYFSFDDNELRNLLFTIYSNISIDERSRFIDSKLNNIKSNNNNNKVVFILFDNINDRDIYEQNSRYKREIRDYLLNNINNNDKLKGSDLLHITDYFCQTIEITKSLLNKTSLQFIKNQNLENIKRFNKSYLIMNSLRKLLYMKFTPIQMMKILCTGSIVLYSAGIRGYKYVNTIGIDSHNDEDFLKKIEESIINKKTKIYYLNRNIKEELNKKILDISGESSFDDICLNPRHHFYLMGIKIYSPKFEIIKKLLRFDEKDIPDILMIAIKYRFLYPNIKLNNNNSVILPKYTNIPTENTYKDAQMILKKRYNINISNISDYFIY